MKVKNNLLKWATDSIRRRKIWAISTLIEDKFENIIGSPTFSFVGQSYNWTKRSTHFLENFNIIYSLIRLPPQYRDLICKYENLTACRFWCTNWWPCEYLCAVHKIHSGAILSSVAQLSHTWAIPWPWACPEKWTENNTSRRLWDLQ